jgi:hypothetical protein
MTAVAADLKRAKADYGKYPYNLAMGQFLGLPIREGNNEPPHGYYMACCVESYYALGVARREAERLIAEGRELLIVAARSSKTRRPIRFQRFRGPDQIRIEGNTAVLSNGKVRATLRGNWSTETCMEAIATALRTGAHYGA